MQVRSAVIPAAGMGTRFLPASKAVPKELLPIGDTPTLQLVIDEALGAVPVQLRVELGRLHMTLAEFAALTPGTVLPMDKFIDDPLPVRIGGRLKAWGRAMVARGAIAVEIISVELPVGSHSNEK